MKPKTIQSILAAALLAPGALFAQTTATTTPVGYVSLTVPANSDSTVGQPLHRSPQFAATGTVSGNAVTVSGGMVASQFVYAPPTQNNAYYLLIKSAGAFNGRYFEVTANTTTQITLDTDIQAAGAPSTISFEVIPYHTLNTLFPNGQGVGVATDILEPTGLVQFRNNNVGVNRGIGSNFFYYQGTEEQGSGWYNNDDLSLGLQNNATIDPYIAVRVRNLEATTKTVVITGTVPTYTVQTPITTAAVANDNYLSVQYPVDVSLSESGLVGSGVVSATDILEPVDLVMVFNDDASGFNKPLVSFYFHYTGTDEQGTGWYNNDNLALGLQNNTKVFKAGRTFVIRKGVGTPGTTNSASTIPYSF